MFELNLNLFLTNISHGLRSELCAASLTRNVTDYTFERWNGACGIVLLNNFTGVNRRGGLKSFSREKVTPSLELHTCWQVITSLLFCFLCSNFYGHLTDLLLRSQSEGKGEREERKRKQERTSWESTLAPGQSVP